MFSFKVVPLIFAVIAFCCTVGECGSQRTWDTYNEFGGDDAQISIELAVLLGPRERQCFYQYIRKGSQLKYSYTVKTLPTTISTNAISTQIRDPYENQLFYSHLEDKVDMPPIEIRVEGVYEFCLNNMLGRFLAKKTEFFIGVINPAHVEKKMDELNETLQVFDDLTEQVSNIRSTIFHMIHQMYFMRRLEGVDFAYLEEKLKYINQWSIFTTLVVVAVAYLQTYILKRFFREPKMTGNVKPRA